MEQIEEQEEQDKQKPLTEEEQKRLMKELEEEKNGCKHKLKNIKVRWMSPNNALIQLECELCKNKFSGLIVKN
jgi:hypothetical protein